MLYVFISLLVTCEKYKIHRYNLEIELTPYFSCARVKMYVCTSKLGVDKYCQQKLPLRVVSVNLVIIQQIRITKTRQNV